MRPPYLSGFLPDEVSPSVSGKDRKMSIFYIIGVVVVGIIVAGYLGIHI
jgi:hypothetical protein